MLGRPVLSATLVVQTVALALLAGLSGGCGFFRGAVLLWGQDETKKIPAEYPHLAGKKVCAVVWADQYTLFEYRWAQLDLSEFVRAAIEQTVRGVSFVPNRQVLDFQDHNPDWDQEPAARIGSRFGAERVLMIELTQYTTREADSPHLKRGHIAANVKVYDTAYPEAEPAYKTTVEVSYPPESTGAYGVDDRSIRRATMQTFAAELAKKFYDREEKAK